MVTNKTGLIKIMPKIKNDYIDTASFISNQEELSINLRTFRKKKKLTQQCVADKIGVERSTYSYYESGKTKPNIYMLIKLSEVFEIDFINLILKIS